MAKIYIGCSGWTFPGWRGNFYPKGVTQKKELEFASRQLSSIEINGTFYSAQKPATFQKWHDAVPDDFVFAVKGPQFITHVRRLKDVESALANFLASGLLCLKEKLGPILWQFPPSVILKDDRFEKFFEMLPHDSKAAATLSQNHSEWMKDRCFTEASSKYPVRHAFEFRHASFMNPDFIKLMRKHNIAVVFAHSGAEKAPYIEDVTADFIYARMHGQEAQFKKGYASEKKTLAWFAKRVAAWSSGKQPKDAHCLVDKAPPAGKKDVFVYFDTEEKLYAPQDAMALRRHLDGE